MSRHIELRDPDVAHRDITSSRQYVWDQLPGTKPTVDSPRNLGTTTVSHELSIQEEDN